MKEFFGILQQCDLFAGIAESDLPGLLACLGADTVAARKHTAVFSEGEPARYVGIVLEGMVQIVQDDYYGNRSILAQAGPGELIGESFACAGVKALPVTVLAAEDCKVLRIDCCRITLSCTNACGFHNQMILNLLQVVAAKNLSFHKKLEITARRTTREKLMAYLLWQAKVHNADSFTIPFDRQGLADYLGVERSAMSAELSKLKKDGIIDFDRNHFTLKAKAYTS